MGVLPFTFTPLNGWRDTTAFPETPSDETTARALFQLPHDQLAAYVNKLAQGICQIYSASSANGIDYTVTADPAWNSYSADMNIGIIPTMDAIGVPTLNINNLGVRPIVYSLGYPACVFASIPMILHYNAATGVFVVVFAQYDYTKRQGWTTLPLGNVIASNQFTIPGDWSFLLQKYDKIYIQGNYYYIYTTPTYNALKTTITLLGPTSLINIGGSVVAFYSKEESPQGFPSKMSISAPVFTTTGVGFTNAPTSISAYITIKNGMCTAWGTATSNAASGSPTGIIVMTFTGLPAMIDNALGGNSRNWTLGQSGFAALNATNVIYIAKPDGTILVPGNSQTFTYRVDFMI